MNEHELAAALTDLRPELVRYLTRLTGNPADADDLVQATYLRASDALQRAPSAGHEMRRWLFRIATNLALDELRRRKRWRAVSVIELREIAEANAAFMERSTSMIGSPEAAHVVREHIDTCFGCVVRNLPLEQSSAVLLRELHGFSYDEVADILGARPAQVKNWIQAGRQTMDARYGETCALVTKQGVCHQCSELSAFFRVPEPSAVGVTDGSLQNRVTVIQSLNSAAVDEWHRLLLSVAANTPNA